MHIAVLFDVDGDYDNVIVVYVGVLICVGVAIVDVYIVDCVVRVWV